MKRPITNVGEAFTHPDTRAREHARRAPRGTLRRVDRECTRPERERAWERIGPDVRAGLDATPSDVMERFGFRGVEWGAWVPQHERQRFLNAFADACHDLCEALGVPPGFASLGGRLGLAYGSRGAGVRGGAAHFDAKRGLIHLTRTSGIGALAHELGHALDAYWFTQCASVEQRPLSRRYLSHLVAEAAPGASLTCDDVPVRHPRLAQAARAWWEVLRFDAADPHLMTYYYQDQTVLESGRAAPYWTRPTELFARSFEMWVCERLSRSGRFNGLLVRGCDARFGAEDWGMPASPFPRGTERVRILDAFGYALQVGLTPWHIPKQRPARAPGRWRGRVRARGALPLPPATQSSRGSDSPGS
jgi:hypothetical protein